MVWAPARVLYPGSYPGLSPRRRSPQPRTSTPTSSGAVAKESPRVGGTRLVCMEKQTPNGTMKMWFTGEYRDIVENERLVYTESMSDEHGNILDPVDMGMPADHPATNEITVELDDLGDRTRMIMTHAGIPADSPGALGWNIALDKLATYISTRP
ncbi:SRPBCC family protein [Cryobacterium psychrophilum]|nr:SRPBCC domain-containing protein [Cryobacterium psychrophilum]TDW28755.1 uncharacterized protein YndB with AHSA1/START domain [Cryobacterium psychrophilum]